MRQVLVSYVGDLVRQKCVEDEQERKEVSISVFVSLERILLDIDIMPGEEALKKVQDRLGTEHRRGMTAWCF